MMNSWNLQGKRALVTGGSKGIGKAIVNEFLTLGAEVLFTARHASNVAAVEQEFRQMGFPVHGVVADVALDQDRKRLLEWINRQWGYLDIRWRSTCWALLSSAGASSPFCSKAMAPQLSIFLLWPAPSICIPALHTGWPRLGLYSLPATSPLNGPVTPSG
jgi:NAD(P)-dependent dehydrogenase (short-subunit alcohol dehydrogenase family)